MDLLGGDEKIIEVSVIMPAYNEGAQIRQSISEACAALQTICPEYELIVVDDGSTDATFREAAKEIGSSQHVTVLKSLKNQGKGRAILKGWQVARGRVFVLTDADLEIHPRQIRVFLETLEKTGADLVVGSKRHAASVLKYPHSRKMMSYLYNLFVRILFLTRLRDTQTGLKIIRKEVADIIMPKLRTGRFAFDVELLMVAHHFGFRIEEAPVQVNFGRNGILGRFTVKQILGMILDTLKIFIWLYLGRTYIRALKKELGHQQGT